MSGALGSTRRAEGEFRSPLEFSLFSWDMLQLVWRAELALSRLPRCPTSFSGFAATGVRVRSRSNSSGSGDPFVPRQAETCPGPYEWPKPRGELRSPDKLKHVPQEGQTTNICRTSEAAR
jgi:hypothetical protein